MFVFFVLVQLLREVCFYLVCIKETTLLRLVIFGFLILFYFVCMNHLLVINNLNNPVISPK